MLMQADQQPGKDAYARYEELKAHWQNLETELSAFQPLKKEADED